MRAAATIMPASRHHAARGLRRRCAMPGVARGHATILNIHRSVSLSTRVSLGPRRSASRGGPGPVTLTLPRSAAASRRLDDHDGFIYNSWLRIPYILLSAPPARRHGCARRHMDEHGREPPKAIASNPAKRERKSGFQAADGGHHARARRRRTAASLGRPAARHKATKPPPRAHLANELGSLQLAPLLVLSPSSPVRRWRRYAAFPPTSAYPQASSKRGCTSARELQASSKRAQPD